MQRTYHPTLRIGVTANADLAYKYRFVDVAGNYASAGEQAIGILETPVEDEDLATVVCEGTCLIEASAAIAAGAQIGAATSGKAVTYSSGQRLGFALNAATADGDLIEMKLSL
ncbi:DUF2190 family protein [Patescibacteria group bacterium]|nr:DUF2190 family protein [Patescibacteria group bacterium]